MFSAWTDDVPLDLAFLLIAGSPLLKSTALALHLPAQLVVQWDHLNRSIPDSL
jgi:hypothetical protein